MTNTEIKQQIEDKGREFKDFLASLISAHEIDMARHKIDEAVLWAKEAIGDDEA